MKKSIISLAVAAGLIASIPAAHAGDVKVKWFGYGQITAKQGDGTDLGTINGTTGNIDNYAKNTDPVFGADRVRFGFKIKDGNIFGKLQADLNRKHNKAAKAGTLPEIIKDIEAGYKFSNAASLKAGQFKTPVGMDFNTSGKKLDITKRGMEKALVLERTAGIMLSGRKIGNGFGYDLFYGNVAGRSAASATSGGAGFQYANNSDVKGVGATGGKDHTIAARVMYDMGKMMHVELGYGTESNSGTSTSAAGIGADDYTVLDFGLKAKMGKAHTIKFEYIDGSSVWGIKGNDETVWYAHYGFLMSKSTEFIVRYYEASQDVPADNSGFAQDPGYSAKLTNTYLGVNFYLGSNKTNGRIQLNYVIAGGDNNIKGDGKVYGGIAGGAKVDSKGNIGSGNGYYDDVILAQYQVSF